MNNTSSAAVELTPWEELEAGVTCWSDFSPVQQEKIVKHYGPKIRYIAIRIKLKLPRTVELGELISAGTLGLMEALGKFKPQLGVHFESYAENRIRGAMLDELRRLDWIPRSLRQKVKILEEAIGAFEHDYGRMPTEEDLQKRTGMELKDIRQGLEALENQSWISLDSIQDNICQEVSDTTGEPYFQTAKAELAARLIPVLETLTSKERLVLSLYYADECNMREAGEILGITEGRVSQLHSQALGRLKKNFLERYGLNAIL